MKSEVVTSIRLQEFSKDCFQVFPLTAVTANLTVRTTLNNVSNEFKFSFEHARFCHFGWSNSIDKVCIKNNFIWSNSFVTNKQGMAEQQKSVTSV